MTELDITLDITPTPQQRPRFGRGGFAYKSKTQAANERTLEALLLPFRPASPFVGAIKLSFIAFMPIPASAPRKTKEAMLADKVGHCHRPDVDNLTKQLLDCLTRLRFWEDDKQVVELHGRKQYSDRPRWEIALCEVCNG